MPSSGPAEVCRGPFGVLLNSPKLAARVADTGAFVRFEFGQPEGLKETLIIATAREMKQQYEFSAHARLARQAGVSEFHHLSKSPTAPPPRDWRATRPCW